MSPRVVTFLAVHGRIWCDQTVLACRGCGRDAGLGLLASDGLAVAYCPCGTAITHPGLSEPLVLDQHERLRNQARDDTEQFVAGADAASWPPALLERYPGLAGLVEQLPARHAAALAGSRTHSHPA